MSYPRTGRRTTTSPLCLFSVFHDVKMRTDAIGRSECGQADMWNKPSIEIARKGYPVIDETAHRC